MESDQLRAEGFGGKEWLAGVTVKARERVEALGVAVLRLALRGSGHAAESAALRSAPKCAARVFAASVPSSLASGCECLSHAWKLPGLVSIAAAGRSHRPQVV